MNMIERVARSIWNIRRKEEDRCDMELEDMSPSHSVWAEARAAIEAMREPTAEMVSAGNKSKPYNLTGWHEGDVHPVCQRSWPAMIDAALK